MAKDLNRSIKIYIDTSDAMKKSLDLETRMSKLRQTLVDLDAQGKRNTPEYARTEKALKNLSSSYGRYQEKLKETERILKNLSGATEKELLSVRSALRADLKKTIQNTEEYKAKLQALLAVERQLAIVEKEKNSAMGKNGSMWSRMADGFNKYFGIVTSVVAGITGLSFALRKVAEDNAKMDDVYSDVMKTTGMARDEVLDLNETFKKMDTRTARDELNLLGRDAGKLGLTGRKDILDFIEAGNQINVALGEDLGEGAIKNIGKITDVYKLSTKVLDTMDLKGRMLAIGSAINELGQSSTASEAYMVNFTQRLGGVASQAGISVQNILGYASALDQSGQAVEMSATALQKFIMKLMGEPAKFAKMAGLEVKEFNKLLKTDTNEAIKQVLSALSDKGGFQALIPIFKDMGLDGARAVGVLSALATNIEKVNKAQEISNKAFADGTSITDEYSIKNNNMNAQLEKARKAFKDTAMEVGETLNPVLLTSTKWSTHLIKLLPVLIAFFEKYGKIILSVAATIGTYIAVVKTITALTGKWTIVETLHYRALQAKNGIMITLRGTLYALQVAYYTLTGQVAKARGAMLAFAAVTGMTNPLVIMTAVIAALAAGIYILSRNTKEAVSTAKMLNEVQKDAKKSIAGEKSELDLLLTVARNEKISKEERLKAIKRINEISPEYLGYLNLENINTKKATESIEAYTTALLKNAQAKSIQGKVESQYDKRNENLLKIKQENDLIKEKQKELKAYTDESAIYTVDEINNSRKRIKELEIENAQIDENIKTYTGFYEQTLNVGKQGLVNELQMNRSYLAEYEKQHADTYNKIQENKKNVFYSQADEARDMIELNLLSQKLDTQRKLVQEQESEYANSVKPEKVADDVVAPLTDKEIAKALKKQKEDLSILLENLETKHQERLLDIKKRYQSGKIGSESEYQTEVFSQEQAFYLLQENLLTTFIKKVSDKALKSDIAKQIAELRVKQLDEQIKFQQKLEKIILDANPEEKEKKAYADRLRDLKLFGTSKEALLFEIAAAETEEEKQALQKKYDVFILLEQEFQDNLVKIRKDAKAKKKAKSEEDFEEDFAERKAQLQQGLADDENKVSIDVGMGALTGEGAFNAEVALQEKRIALLQQEVEARQKAGLDITRVLQKQRREELGLTQLYVKEYNRRTQQFAQYGEAMGSTLGNAIANQENLLSAFAGTALDILFDVLSQIISAEIAKVTAVGASTIFQASANEIGSKGFIGIGTAAILTGVITAAMVTAKTALKGLLGGKKGSSSGSNNSGSNSERVYAQRAAGKYDVIGQDDGKLYKNVPYAGLAQTGVVSKPTLMGEQGSELVVSHPDFKALQKHVNYPLIVQAITDVRAGRIPQRADGKYDSLPDSPETNPDLDLIKLLLPVLNRLIVVMQELRDKDLEVNYYKFENAKKTVERARDGAKKR